MKTLIHVTDRHIDRGIGQNARACAISIAGEEFLPGYEVIVGPSVMVLISLLDRETTFHRLPPNIVQFIYEFDSWRNYATCPRPAPISFEIEIPDQETHEKAVSTPSIACSNAPETELVSR